MGRGLRLVSRTLEVIFREFGSSPDDKGSNPGTPCQTNVMGF